MAHSRIARDPKIMMGKPVIRGTRITVEIILRKLAEGHQQADLLDDWPHLSADDIQAALAFAADYMAHETVLGLEGAAE